jgi:hypothetical protein
MSGALRAEDGKAMAARWSAYGRRILAGDAPGAEKAFAKATQLDPQNAGAWEGLIEAFQADGKDEQARWAYRQMAKVAPKAAAAGYLLVRGWPPPSGHVAGYYLYLSEEEEGGFHKVSPLITGSSFRVEELLPGRRYYLLLTALSDGKPPVESRPSSVWSMVAKGR